MLLGYGILLFLHFYKEARGAAIVGIVDGHYAVFEGGRVIRTMSEQEYRRFWNLWTRASSAWIGLIAANVALQFPSVRRHVHTQEK